MIAARLRMMATIGAVLVLAALALFATVQTFRLASTQADLRAEKDGRRADRAAVVRAQSEATALALAEKLKKEKEDAEAAQLAQADYDALRQRYAGVLRSQGAGGAPGRADLPRTASATGISDEAAAGAGLPVGAIIIAQSDALICADNTAYAQAAFAWAEGIAKED